MITLYNGDCLKIMDKLISEGIKVDAIITDPPYGTTACKWDTIIPLDKMWGCLNELIKENGVICLFGAEPFSSILRISNLKDYKYDWYWLKNCKTGHLNAHRQPMRSVEMISVFYKKQVNYMPQGLKQYNKIKNRYSNAGTNRKAGTVNFQKFTGYPDNRLSFNRDKESFHPTQKPVALMEYLIKTYTNEGDIVLDFTMGSGSTGVACLNTNRNFIGIELDEKYFKIAQERCGQSN